MPRLKPAPLLTLSHLAMQWLHAKEDETLARERRVTIEEKLSVLVPGPDEGASHGTDAGYDVTVTRSYTRSIDLDAYEEVRERLGAVDPVVFKPSLDIKKYRAAELAAPETFRLVQTFVTIKPAKPTIKVEEVKTNV